MHWRFVDWSSLWLRPPLVMLGLGIGVALLLNLAIAHIWYEHRAQDAQQKELVQQNIQISRSKLIKQLKAYHVETLDLGYEYQELSALYPVSFSRSDFYSYISSKLPQGVEVKEWKWKVDEECYRLLVTVEGSFAGVRSLVTLALGYLQTSRLESAVLELREQRLVAELELGFYVRRGQSED